MKVASTDGSTTGPFFKFRCDGCGKDLPLRPFEAHYTAFVIGWQEWHFCGEDCIKAWLGRGGLLQ